MNLLSSLLKYTADQIAALRAKDSSQDTTVSGIDTRLGTAETKVTNMEAQLATAISAVTVDSEVQNIRVGDDTVTYTSAGEAVRTQFSNVKDTLWQFLNDGEQTYDPSLFVNGTVDSNGNVDTTFISRVAMANIQTASRQLDLAIATNHAVIYATYDANGNKLTRTAGNTGTLTIPKGTYYRIAIYKTVGESQGTKTPIPELVSKVLFLSDVYTEVHRLQDTADSWIGYSPLSISTTHNVGWYMGDGAGDWMQNADLTTSDPIPVKEGMVIRFRFTKPNIYISRVVFTSIDGEDMNYRPTQQYQIQRIVTSTNDDVVATVPKGANYVFVAWQNNVDNADTIDLAIKVTDSWYNIDSVLDEFGDENFNLPSKLYALVGQELNVYFDNLVQESKDYKVDISCTIGEQLDRCYRVVPSTTGEYSLSITLSKGRTSITRSTTIYVEDADTTTEKTAKVIVIGDSTTNGGLAVHLLVDNATGKKVAVSALGTRGDGRYKHEGRSGWTAYNYTHSASYGGYDNAFYNPSTNAFDFAYYLSHNSIDAPDVVIINLGINDVFSVTNDTDLDAYIDTYVTEVNAMISSIHDYDSSIKVLVCMTIPPNRSQYAFGKAYGCGQTRDRYKRNNYGLVKRIISEYSGKESSNVYAIPIHTNLDTVYNMGTTAQAVNNRNTQTENLPTAYSSVHPEEVGLWQIADVYWFAITAIA